MDVAPVRGLDHLLLGAADLAEGVSWVAERLGIEPARGGQHPRWGTANYLLSLGADIYLEVIGPDPDVDPGSVSLPYALDGLTSPRLVAWAAKGSDLWDLVHEARAAGVPLGEVREGSRRVPDGSLLTWELTDPDPLREGGVIPFFIDWGDTRHPAATAPAGGKLLEFRAEHPAPGRVANQLGLLNLDLPVGPGERPALLARVRRMDGKEVEI